jgi:hypothetical protein
MFTLYFCLQTIKYSNWSPSLSFYSIGEYLPTKKSFELTKSHEFYRSYYYKKPFALVWRERRVMLRKDGI